jgi:hypothetical protein
MVVGVKVMVMNFGGREVRLKGKKEAESGALLSASGVG